MKFRYYITNLLEGNIEGTDDGKVAEELAECEEFFVVDTNTGEWLQSGGKCVPVAPTPLSAE